MSSYQVLITELALTDMAELHGYISEKLQAADAADRVYDRIADSIMSLSVFPERCRLLDSEPECERGMRRLLVDDWSIIYVISSDVVTVLRVLYSSSDIKARLAER